MMSQSGDWPTACAEVSYDMADASCGEPEYEAELGDLIWDPKGGEGHVLVAEAVCGTTYNGHHVDCSCGGWAGPCSATTLICECGQDDSWRDHHYYLLARKPTVGAEPEHTVRGQNAT